jgi:hypothetical protein
VVDGKIREHRAQSDPLMLLRQIGASPQQMADVILIPPRDPLPTTRV